MDERAVTAAFGHVSKGTVSRIALDLVREVVAQEQYTADLEMYRAIDSGTLTPERAMMAFAGKRTLFKLLSKLDSIDRVGQTAAKRLKDQGAA